MRIPDYGKVTISVSVLGIIALLVVAKKLEPQSGPQTQPRKPADMGVNVAGIFEDIWPKGEGDHFCHPDMSPTPMVYTPHRYPHRAGHEIATVIERGFPAMLVRKPQDYDWIIDPPSEATL